jgi:polyhydroxyalkanoate synthesis regulator phasin
MLALCMAHIRQRLTDDLGIDAMIESSALTIQVRNGGLMRRNESKSFRDDLRRRIREAQELLERAGFAVSDEALVDALEQSNGMGSKDARALWGEIERRGLAG